MYHWQCCRCPLPTWTVAGHGSLLGPRAQAPWRPGGVMWEPEGNRLSLRVAPLPLALLVLTSLSPSRGAVAAIVLHVVQLIRIAESKAVCEESQVVSASLPQFEATSARIPHTITLLHALGCHFQACSGHARSTPPCFHDCMFKLTRSVSML